MEHINHGDNDQFSLALVSNGSMKEYPDNTLSHFRTHLHHPIELDGNWEVGLSQIMFPPCSYTFPEGAIIMKRRLEGEPLCEYYIDGPLKLKSVQDFFDRFKTGAKIRWTQTGTPDFDIECSIDNEDRVTLSYNGDLLFEDSRLIEMFGFPSHAINTLFQEKMFGLQPYDLLLGAHSYFVYTNIIKSSLLADTKAPILRIVSNTLRQRKKGEFSCASTLNDQKYNPIYYYPLISNNIRDIAIEIRKSDGELVPFMETGITVVYLHFRKIK